MQYSELTTPVLMSVHFLFNLFYAFIIIYFIYICIYQKNEHFQFTCNTFAQK